MAWHWPRSHGARTFCGLNFTIGAIGTSMVCLVQTSNFCGFYKPKMLQLDPITHKRHS